MFEALSKRLQGAFQKLSGQAKIDEKNVDEALKERPGQDRREERR
jgi:signal recognition particle GTPase